MKAQQQQRVAVYLVRGWGKSASGREGKEKGEVEARVARGEEGTSL